MGQRSDQITREIDRTRNDLGNNLQELEDKVKDVTDWRSQFQKNPLTMIGLAFGGGIFLSRVIGGSSRSHRRYRSGDGADKREEDHSSRTHEAGTRHELAKAADTWDSIKGALIGVAANKAQDFLREAVPGFHEEYSKVERHKKAERPAGLTSPDAPPPAGL